MKKDIFDYLVISILVVILICFVVSLSLIIPNFNDVSKIIIYNDNFDIVREFIGDIDILRYASNRIEFICDGVNYCFYNVRFEIVK